MTNQDTADGGLTFSYPRYLASKRTVDERARHPRLWAQMMSFCREVCHNADRPLRILEVGGGVGDLAGDILEALPDGRVDYTLLDVDADNLQAASSNLNDRLPEADIVHASEQLSSQASSTQKRIILRHGNFLDCRERGSSMIAPEEVDLVVGQAVMDILPVEVSMDTASSILRPGGIGYFPIHVDGLTEFEPTEDEETDAMVSDLYHESMRRRYELPGNGRRYASNGSRCGRDLLVYAPAAGMDIVDAASSDWVVYPHAGPGGKRTYPAQEADFLRYMLGFVEEELTGHADLDADAFAEWVSRRRQQIEAGELILVVHNLDVLVRRRGE